jgi:hypothetical protein
MFWASVKDARRTGGKIQCVRYNHYVGREGIQRVFGRLYICVSQIAALTARVIDKPRLCCQAGNVMEPDSLAYSARRTVVTHIPHAE